MVPPWLGPALKLWCGLFVAGIFSVPEGKVRSVRIWLQVLAWQAQKHSSALATAVEFERTSPRISILTAFFFLLHTTLSSNEPPDRRAARKFRGKCASGDEIALLPLNVLEYVAKVFTLFGPAGLIPAIWAQARQAVGFGVASDSECPAMVGALVAWWSHREEEGRGCNGCAVSWWIFHRNSFLITV